MYFFQYLPVISSIYLLPISVFAAPDPLITPKPKAPTEAQLQRRSNDSGPNVFGYINGDVNSPLGCGAGYQWSSESDLGACCNQASCTNVIFTCVDKQGGIDICSGANSGLCGNSITVLHCKSPEPSCFRYMRITDAQDLSPNYIYRCGTASEDVTVLVTPTNEAAVQTSATQTPTRVSSFVRSTASTTKSQQPSSETTGSGSSGSPAGGAESSSTSSTSSTSSGNTWKYAAIGVGSVVVILLLVGAVFCLWRRQRQVKPVVNGGPGIGYNPGHQQVPMQYMDTIDGSVMVEMPPSKIESIRNWEQAQRVGTHGGASDMDGETLVDTSSRGRY